MKSFTATLGTKYAPVGEKRLVVSCYINNKSPALMIQTLEGEPLLTASIALDYIPEDDCIILKDWSENEGIVDGLLDAGLIEPAIAEIPTGFVVATMHRMKGALLTEWHEFQKEEQQRISGGN